MANRIKGITVEIGGDTTKLQTALKQVNTEIKHTQSELRDVNKLLKLDPGNTELISQKHKLLGQTLEETKNKLTSLKEAQKQAEQALAEGKISQEQYDAPKREIIETEQALKSLERQGATTNQTLQNIAVTGEKWQNTGQNIENVGRKMMPVSLAVAGLGAAAVKTASDFDSGMEKVKAVSGATGSDFDALREKAREMGAKTKFSSRGYELHGHVGGDVGLYVYGNNVEPLTGTVHNHEIGKYNEKVMGTDLNKLTDELFIYSRDAFTKKGCQVEFNYNNGNQILEVTKDGNLYQFPTYRNYAIVNGEKVEIGGLTVFNGEKIYVPQGAVDLVN